MLPRESRAREADEIRAFFQEFFARETEAGTIRNACALYADPDRVATVLPGPGATVDREKGRAAPLLPLGRASQILTAAALTKLAGARGRELQRPAREFVDPTLASQRIDPGARSMAALLSWSSGLADRRLALYAAGQTGPGDPHAAYLRKYPPIPLGPGDRGVWDAAPAWALAGAAVVRLGGRPFTEYMEGQFLPALGMQQATYVPATGDRSPFGTPLLSRLPAYDGALATPADIAALLRWLNSPAGVELRRLRRPAESAPGFGMGLREGRRAGHSFLYRDTGLPRLPGRLLLDPNERSGYFVIARADETDWLDRLSAAYLERFHGTRASATIGDATEDTATEGELVAADLAGTYAFAGRPRYTVEKFMAIFAALKVEAVENGLVAIKPEIAGRWCGLDTKTFFRPDGPGRLRSVDPRDGSDGAIFIAAAFDPAGVARLYCDRGERITFERLAWYEYPGLHVRIFLLVLGLAITLVLLGRYRGNPGPDAPGADSLAERLRRLARVINGLMSLVLLGLLPAFFLFDSAAEAGAEGPGWPAGIVLGLGLFAAGLGSSLLFLGLRGLFQGAFRRGGGAYLVATLATFGLFLSLMFYWNLLGFQY